MQIIFLKFSDVYDKTFKTEAILQNTNKIEDKQDIPIQNRPSDIINDKEDEDVPLIQKKNN